MPAGASFAAPRQIRCCFSFRRDSLSIKSVSKNKTFNRIYYACLHVENQVNMLLCVGSVLQHSRHFPCKYAMSPCRKMHVVIRQFNDISVTLVCSYTNYDLAQTLKNNSRPERHNGQCNRSNQIRGWPSLGRSGLSGIRMDRSKHYRL